MYAFTIKSTCSTNDELLELYNLTCIVLLFFTDEISYLERLHMWDQFVFSFLMGLVVIYLPGFFFFRAVRFNAGTALISAPLFSISFYSLTGIVLFWLSIPCNAYILFFAATILSVLSFCTAKVIGKKRPIQKPIFFNSIDWPMLALYIVVGLVLCTVFFLKNLDGANSFFCRADNITHLNVVNAFIESNTWSSLHAGNYIDGAYNPFGYGSGGFYPAAWHQLVGIVCVLTQAPIPLSVNAINAIFISVTYPASMYLLLTNLFEGNKKLIALGSVVSLAFTAFPLGLFLKGPLYPNLASNCLAPIVMALFAEFVTSFGKKDWLAFKVASFIIFGFLAIVALAFTQTNAIFFVYIFAVFWLASYAYGKTKKKTSFRQRYAIPAFVILLGVLFWIVFYNLPFLQSVVQYEWDNDLSLVDALFNTVSLAMAASLPQTLLSIAVLLGVVFCVLKKQYWILCPALLMAVGYLACRCDLGDLEHWLAGFWYTDPYRPAACLVVFLVPIATYGLYSLITLITIAFKALCENLSLRYKPAFIVALSLSLFVVLNFYPTYDYPKTNENVETSFGYVNYKLGRIFTTTDKEQVYTIEEQRFVDEVKKIIPDNATVINMPDDGSMFSYGVNGVHVLYRNSILRDNIPAGETADSKIIRTSLNEITTNDQVRHAVDNVGASYVLILDQGKTGKDFVHIPQFEHPEYWSGLTSIDDSTPGFTLMLSEDDMRLYKIDSI